MDRSAQVYVALRRPEEGGNWTPEERKSLEQLKMFNVRQPLSLLLAVFERFGEEDRRGFQKFLRAITILSFRYNVICGRQSKDQESIYNQIAQEISSSAIENVNEALIKLRPIYPEDREFQAAFEEKVLRTTSYRNNKVVRFILFQLEEHLSGNAFKESDFAITRNLADQYDQWTVEKIRANQRWMAKQATAIWRVNSPRVHHRSRCRTVVDRGGS